MSSFDRILPFVKPLEHLLLDPSITDVMVNEGGRRIFVRRNGAMERVTDCVLDARNLMVAIKNIARACGDDISDAQLTLEARLEDGSRVAAIYPPCAVDGPVLTIRKFVRRYTLTELVALGALTSALAECLVEAVRTRRNILVSGGTGTGKTSLLNALAGYIPDAHRVIVIEETSEIRISQPNTVRVESRRAQPALGQEAPLPAVTIADLLRAILWHHPTRILVGEIRGSEGFDLLQALNSGHQGSMSTIHANSATQALIRLSHCVLAAHMGLPHNSTREAIGLAIDLVVHLTDDGSQRRVTQVIAVQGYDQHTETFLVEPVYDVGDEIR